MDCTRADYMKKEVNKLQRVLDEYWRLQKLESNLTESMRLLSQITDNKNIRVKILVVDTSKANVRIEADFDSVDKDFLKGMCSLLKDYKARTTFDIANL